MENRGTELSMNLQQTHQSDRMIMQIWRSIPLGKRVLIRAILHFNDLELEPHTEEFGFFKTPKNVMAVFDLHNVAKEGQPPNLQLGTDRTDVKSVADYLDRLSDLAEIAVAPQARVRFQIISLACYAPDFPVVMTESQWFSVESGSPLWQGLRIQPMSPAHARVEELYLERARGISGRKDSTHSLVKVAGGLSDWNLSASA